MVELADDVKIYEEEQEQEEDDKLIHASCVVCYPPETADYIISLCGVLKPDDRPGISTDRLFEDMCQECKNEALPHAKTHGF